MRSRRTLLLTAALALLGFGAGAAIVTASSDPPDPGIHLRSVADEPPPWPADLPKPDEPIPVATPEGDLLRCPQDGELLKVADTEEPPPQLGKSELTNQGPGEVYRITETVVPRCGPTGGGADGEPIWVPSSEAEVDTAPKRYVRQQTP
ncbi:MAG: hypothetical protein ACRDK9_07080 [Solirubrobacterales bacterium]